MIASFLKSIGGKLVGYFLGIVLIVYGVVVDDVRRLCHMSELRKRYRKDFLRYQEFTYNLFVSGFLHDISPDLADFKREFDKMSIDDRKTIRVDDRLYGRMRRVLFWNLLFDAMMSFALTSLIALGGLFGYRVMDSEWFQRLTDFLGL